MTESLVPVLESRLPQFAKELYPKFVRYVTDYLKWLETDDHFLRLVEDFRNNIDVSNDADLYVSAILRDLGFDIEQDFTVRKSVVVATLRDFLLARGTKKSFKYLFRLLFDSDVEIRYPRDELLIPSVAEFGTRFFTFTTAANIDTETFDFILTDVLDQGGSLIGLVSKAGADIENIRVIYGLTGPFLEIETLQPVFPLLSNETVRIAVGDNSIIETITPNISFKVTSGGNNYSVGDQITITGASVQGRAHVSAIDRGGIETVTITNAGTGYSVGDRIKVETTDDIAFGFSAYVATVGGSGEITAIKIENRGYGFTKLPTLVVASAGTGAVLTAGSSKIGAISNIEFSEACLGYGGGSAFSIDGGGSGAVLEAVSRATLPLKSWASRKGFVGETSRLIDSDRYQQFSYSIVSPVPHGQYESAVGQFLHPSGFVRFGVYEIISETSVSFGTDEPLDSVIITLESEHSVIIISSQTEIDVQPILGVDTGSLDVLSVNGKALGLTF